jgi:hypothetical protein
MAAEDDERKRETMLEVLDKADYLTISSNRFYDSLSRIPTRFPMSIDYYDVLFSGELGFELVLEWTSYPRVWDIEWKNQVLPTDDLPAWMNEYEVEEAFTVYDHPAIFVFRKTDVYSPERVRQLLDTNLRQYKETFGGLGADALPVNRNVVIAPQASVAPSALMLPDDLAAEQKHSTWSDMFDVKASINENQTLARSRVWCIQSRRIGGGGVAGMDGGGTAAGDMEPERNCPLFGNRAGGQFGLCLCPPVSPAWFCAGSLAAFADRRGVDLCFIPDISVCPLPEP